jgi:chromosome segregation ATPase
MFDTHRPQLGLVQETSPRLRIKMLTQMAGTLEAEAADLCDRTATLEEEESLLTGEITTAQAELNRLSSRLDSVRLERDALLERIEELRSEAAEMRDEITSNEDDIALDSLRDASVLRVVGSGSRARRVTENRRRRWHDA